MECMGRRTIRKRIHTGGRRTKKIYGGAPTMEDYKNAINEGNYNITIEKQLKYFQQHNLKYKLNDQTIYDKLEKLYDIYETRRNNSKRNW